MTYKRDEIQRYKQSVRSSDSNSRSSEKKTKTTTKIAQRKDE